MPSEVQQKPGFFERLGLAFKLLGDPDLALKLREMMSGPAPKAAAEPPEKVHASGLFVLATLQQDGRFIDFLQQDVTSFSDEDVGAAARVVHGGCRKALQNLVSVSPAMRESEGATVTVPTGFDAQRIRLTGNVTGQPPYKGVLKHQGWVVSELRFPSLSPGMDYKVLAPAEVELS